MKVTAFESFITSNVFLKATREQPLLLEEPFASTIPESMKSVSLLVVWLWGFNHCLFSIGSITLTLHFSPELLFRGQRSKRSYNDALCIIDWEVLLLVVHKNELVLTAKWVSKMHTIHTYLAFFPGYNLHKYSFLIWL